MRKNSKFNVNKPRVDPYKNYPFRLKWEVNGEWRTFLGFSKVSGLKRTTELVYHRQGGEPNTCRKTPDRTKYEGITLERGVTTDPEFEQWANTVLPREKRAEKYLAKFRRNLKLEVLNEKLKPILRYNLYGCWVCEYTLP